MGRDDRIYEEAVALWRQLHSEPPPAADGAAILGLIVGGLAEPEYDRLATPHLRTANVAFPKP